MRAATARSTIRRMPQFRCSARTALPWSTWVVLKAPKLEGDKLTFNMSVLEGGLSKAEPDQLRSSSTGSRRAAALAVWAASASAMWVMSAASATMAPRGMARGTPIPAPHWPPALRSAPSAQRRLAPPQPAATIPIRLAIDPRRRMRTALGRRPRCDGGHDGGSNKSAETAPARQPGIGIHKKWAPFPRGRRLWYALLAPSLERQSERRP